MHKSLHNCQKGTSSSLWREHFSPHRMRQDVWTWDNWFQPLVGAERDTVLKALARVNPAVEAYLRHDRPCYVLGYLAAPRRYMDGDDGPQKHHFHSALGVAVTDDFSRYQVVNNAAFKALRGEGSIWSGCFVKGVERRQEGDSSLFYFFYTHRDTTSADPLAQQISAARTRDFTKFTRTELSLAADPRWYETACIPGDTSVHAFRDPYPFRHGNNAYMLVSAKSKLLAPGRIGEISGKNGVVAVYRGSGPGTLRNWEATPLCFDVGKSEAEVPSIYFDAKRRQHVILFSCQSEASYLARTRGAHGEVVSAPGERGELYYFVVKNLAQLLDSPPEQPVKVRPVPIPLADSGCYAFRFTPDGRLLGFNGRTGRPKILSTNVGKNLILTDQDFSSFDTILPRVSARGSTETIAT